MARRMEEAAREALLARRRDLVERTHQQLDLEDAASESRGRDVSDHATLIETLAGLEGLRRVEELELAAIDRALARIDAGTYGLCERCGEAIEGRRLEAVPWTRACRACVTRVDDTRQPQP